MENEPPARPATIRAQKKIASCRMEIRGQSDVKAQARDNGRCAQSKQLRAIARPAIQPVVTRLKVETAGDPSMSSTSPAKIIRTNPASIVLKFTSRK